MIMMNIVLIPFDELTCIGHLVPGYYYTERALSSFYRVSRSFGIEMSGIGFEFCISVVSTEYGEYSIVSFFSTSIVSTGTEQMDTSF